MTTLRYVLAFGLLSAIVPVAASAQPPVPPAPRQPVPAPLLFVRLAGPPGLRATFFPGTAAPRSFTAPVVAGFRPGYIYQFELTGLPERPDRPDAAREIYPTLEIRGSVLPAPGVSAANFPVPLVFSADEIARAQAGLFLTKVAYLECADQALPVETRLDHPLEIDLRSSGDPVAEARTRGQIVMIIRFGEKPQTPRDLASHWVPNTVLFPGEKALGPAAREPELPWACWPAYDPVLGPRPLCQCLRDGGDAGLPAGIGPDGRLHGLDPADTVAEYSDSKGGRHVTPSNPVCIFAPRFGFIRAEIAPAGYNGVTTPVGAGGVVVQAGLESRWPTLLARQTEAMLAATGTVRASGIQATEGVHFVNEYQGLALAVGRMNGASVVGVCKKPEEQPPDRPLFLCKSADKQTAQVGDVISFQLRYTNRGGQPITDVAVSDSLTGRLEYVPGSQRTDRDAIFTTQENESGSVILRWQFGGSLLPGQTGLISFQARVR